MPPRIRVSGVIYSFLESYNILLYISNIYLTPRTFVHSAASCEAAHQRGLRRVWSHGVGGRHKSGSIVYDFEVPF